MSAEETAGTTRRTGGAVLRTGLSAVAVASIALGAWGAARSDDAPAVPAARAAPVTDPKPSPPDPATSVLNVRPVDGTPYTVLFSGVGPEEAADGPSLFTAPRVEGVHNVVLLDTDTGASRRLLPDDSRLVTNARLLAPVAEDAGTAATSPPPRWIALDVTDDEGKPMDLMIARLDGTAPPVVLPGLTRVVRVWSRDADTLAALVRVDGALAYRLIDGETLTVTSSSLVPLTG